MFKKLGYTLIGSIATLALLASGVAFASTLQGFQGGTGFSTSTSGSDGLCLKQASSSPFLTWSIGTCGTGGSSTTIYPGNGITLSPNPINTTGTVSINTSTILALFSNGTGIFYNASTGLITNVGVTTFNGATGSIIGVNSVNGSSGTVSFTYVASVASSSEIIASTGTGSGITFSLKNPSSTFLKVANNLSDLNATATARTNIGYTGLSPVGISSTGTISCTTCLTANQLITLSLTGDATGTATGTTSISVTSTVLKLQGVAVTSSAPTTGDVLQYNGTLWTHNPTSTVLAGYMTSTPPQFASGSLAFNIYDATTTAPYRYAKWPASASITIAKVECNEYAAATTTIQLYKTVTLGTTTLSSTIVASIACGIGGTSTTSFTTSTLAAGEWLIANVSSTAGTPSWTYVGVLGKVN